MSWDLIKAVQSDTDVRLILPFGLALRLGDVVSVARDGTFRLEGSVKSLLNLAPGKSRTGKPVDIEQSSGADTSFQFRAAGQASTVFPNLPAASAALDISLSSAKSWVMVATERSLRSFEDVDRYRQPILDAYRLGVWKPDWALVTEVGTAERLTLLAAQSKETKVALSLGGAATASSGLKAQLTSGVAIAATSNQITQCITDQRMPIACRALRVRDRWWKLEVGDLSIAAAEPGDPLGVSSEEFWEDADEL
jgi:hypothetical protein